MDSFRRQASKLRDQVAKQQQAVIKHISGSGYESSDVMVIDEVELQRHTQLDKLYKSTRSGRDFQKEVVKAAEIFTTLGYRKIEAGTKLAEECCKYGAENTEDKILAKATSIYGDARKHVEKEQEDLNRLLLSQVLDPLRQISTGTPLEDARHLAQRYSRMRQEAEAQAAEVNRRRARVREAATHENTTKLQASEARMQEMKANMAVLGKEAAAALSAVDSQQQRLTFQRLVALLVSEKQQKEATPPILSMENNSEKKMYYLAEAVHAFRAESEKELSLEVGDYVVVRKASPSGWCEGECKGKAGWFPSGYVEKRQRIPARNMAAEAY
ncbi:hypothetical protein KSS87_013547 [Heliosperma pusillum]|nr:hypothetical protein KSS87_013547 [Heliosperma pusillum]